MQLQFADRGKKHRCGVLLGLTDALRVPAQVFCAYRDDSCVAFCAHDLRVWSLSFGNLVERLRQFTEGSASRIPLWKRIGYERCDRSCSEVYREQRAFPLILAFPTYAASSQATRLGFGSAAQTIPLGNCAAVQAVTENSLMQPTGVSAAVTVALSAGSSNVEFFSDAVCGVASASLVVPAGQQSETFFIAGSKAGFVLTLDQSYGVHSSEPDGGYFSGHAGTLRGESSGSDCASRPGERGGIQDAGV